MKHPNYHKHKPSRVMKPLRTKKSDIHYYLLIISKAMKATAHHIKVQTTHVVKHIKKHKKTYV